MPFVLRLKSGNRPCFCDERCVCGGGVVRQKDVLVFSRKRDNLTAVYPCFAVKGGE